MTRFCTAALALALAACGRPPPAAAPPAVARPVSLPAASAPGQPAALDGRLLGQQCSRVGPDFPDYPEPPPPTPRGGWPKIEPKPRLPPVSGCLDRGIIRRVFRQQREELVCCAQALPAGGEELLLTVRFRIDRAGRVDDVTVTPPAATPPEQALGRCLVTVLSSWRWRPAGWGAIQVSYPLRFAAPASL